MNREILFRGKRTDNGEWIEGGYAEIAPPPVCFSSDPVEASKICIVAEKGFADWGMPRQYAMYEVESKTIGQYIGIKDKYGKKIFEADIVKDECTQLLGEVVYANVADGYDGMAGFMVDDINDGMQNYDSFWNLVEVIGNIYDNPELLGET